MATTKERLHEILDALSDLPDVTSRPMMGEYLLYCQRVYCANVCDGTLFVKDTPVGRALVPDAPLQPSHEGAKQLMLRIDDLSDRALLARLIEETCLHLPPPKRRPAAR